MNFINAIPLWAGLAAAGVAVPILLHLLSRRRYRNVDWAAMSLLRQAMRKRSRKLKLENLLLMLLRCAALALLALAMSRPFHQAAATDWDRQGRQMGVVIAIDASYSMSRAAAVRRFDLAVEAARDVARDLRQGDRVTLVLLSQRPNMVLRNVPFEPVVFNRAIADLEPTAQPLALDLALPMLVDLVGELGTAGRRCLVITDGQASDWATLDDIGRGRLADLGRTSKFQIIALGGADSANFAVTSLRHVAGRLAEGSTARFSATVENFNSTDESGQEIEFVVDGQVVDRRDLQTIRSLGSVTVTSYLRMPRAGDIAIEARLKGDALTLDDIRRVAVSVRKHIKVALIDGDPSLTPFASETDFLQASLRSADMGSASKSLSWQRFNASQLETIDLDQFDVLMLANVGHAGPAAADRIRQWVEAGGGLILFLGDQITPQKFNADWQPKSGPWLPATVGPIAFSDAPLGDRGTIEVVAPNHRLGEILEDLPDELIMSASIEQYMKLTPVADAQVIWSIQGAAAPLLVDRVVGQGRVLMFASSADRLWTDLPLYPVFPLFVHEAITHLTMPAGFETYLVGQPIVVPALSEFPADQYIATNPSGRELELSLAATQRGAMVELSHVDQVGFYEFILNPEQPRLVAVNPDTRESDLRAMTDAQWEATLADVTASVSRDAMRVDQLTSKATGPHEYWRYLMIGSIGMFLAEGWLSRRYVKRAHVERASHDSEQPLQKARQTAA